MLKHKYFATWFAVDGGGNSFPKFVAGQTYDITEETTRHAAAGICEVVDVPDAPVETAVEVLAAEAPAETVAPDAPAA